MYDLIIVPFHDYKKWKSEGFRTRDAHLFQHLSKNKEIGKILVINRPTSLAEVLLKRKKWNIPEELVEYKSNSVQLAKIGENQWCLDIFVPDFFKVIKQKKAWWFTSFNYKLVSDAINHAEEYLGLENTVLLLQNPMAIGVSKSIKSDYFVFDAIDNWLYHPQMPDKSLIAKNYSYVDNNADLILTVSKSLKETFSTNRNVHWVPNGVDIDFFSGAIKENFNGDKVIGYVGKIQDRVDFDLVEKCIKTYPNNKFIFLGPIYSQNKKIANLKRTYDNIIFKGDIHYNDLAQNMKEFDIAIIPHKVDKFTNSMNPLKIYEYLASGKPVVSTCVAGSDSLSPFIFTAQTSDDFVKELGSLIFNQRVYNSNDVISSISNECSWETRTSEILNLIRDIK